MIMAGANAIGVWRGMKKASDILLDKLKLLARPISSSEDIHNIGKKTKGGSEGGREGRKEGGMKLQGKGLRNNFLMYPSLPPSLAFFFSFSHHCQWISRHGCHYCEGLRARGGEWASKYTFILFILSLIYLMIKSFSDIVIYLFIFIYLFICPLQSPYDTRWLLRSPLPCWTRSTLRRA